MISDNSWLISASAGGRQQLGEPFGQRRLRLHDAWLGPMIRRRCEAARACAGRPLHQARRRWGRAVAAMRERRLGARPAIENPTHGRRRLQGSRGKGKSAGNTGRVWAPARGLGAPRAASHASSHHRHPPHVGGTHSQCSPPWLLTPMTG